MLKIGVVFGGLSAEHEVSLAGARGVLGVFENLDGYEAMPIGIGKSGNWYTGKGALEMLISKADDEMLFVKSQSEKLKKKAVKHTSAPIDYIDQCDFIMLLTHGVFGEDGRLQGFFEMLGKDVIGCSVLASSVCFNKAFLKRYLSAKGFKVTPGVDIYLDETDITEKYYKSLCNQFGTKKFVIKPADNGSSIGLGQASNYEEFKSAIEEAGEHTNHVVIEIFMPHREIVVGVIGRGEDILISDLGESNVADVKVYNYEEKYIQHSDCKVPAEMNLHMEADIRKQTAAIYKLTESSGWSRIDFFIEKDTNDIYVNEVNTIPGMSEPSVFPQIFRSTGLTYPELIETILDKSIRDTAVSDAIKMAA